MKKHTLAFASLVIGLGLGGCASTSDSGSNAKTAVYPEMKVMSTNIYSWDDSISEALNVARMAQPAGVGTGLRDFADGKEATTGRISGGTRLFDAALGAATMGPFGILSMESLNQRVNSELDWGPSIIELISVDMIDTANGKNLRYASEIIGRKIGEAIKDEYGVEAIHGIYSPKKVINSNVAILISDLNLCEMNFKYMAHDKEKAIKFVEFPLDRFYLDASGNSLKHCAVTLDVKISGKTMINGKEEYIVVGEVMSGHFFNGAIIKHYNGRVLVPDSHEINSTDKSMRITINRPYAFLSENGEEKLFMK